MKPNWTCPKCKAKDPIHVPGKKGGPGGVEVTRFLRGNLQPSRYVCGKCGFVEEYFETREHLDAVRRKHGAR
jgi:rubredoxin